MGTFVEKVLSSSYLGSVTFTTDKEQSKGPFLAPKACELALSDISSNDYSRGSGSHEFKATELLSREWPRETLSVKMANPRIGGEGRPAPDTR